jgi:hypothetical protein
VLRGDCEGDCAGAKKRQQVQQCRGTEQMQSRFRSAEVQRLCTRSAEEGQKKCSGGTEGRVLGAEVEQRAEY